MTLWACVGASATVLSLAFVANVVWAVAEDRGIWQLVGLPAAGAFWYWAVSVARERFALARGGHRVDRRSGVDRTDG
jgi:hypothetical protein